MFNSTILDLAIGLVFTFLAVSLAVSAITETIASALKLRSKTLMQGIEDLLNDPGLAGLGRQLYQHALVNPRGNGNGTAVAGRTLPAYIDPRNFAHALMDITGITGQPGLAAIRTAVGTVQNPQLQALLTGIVESSTGNLAGISDEIARWFDAAMDRVSGVYKRLSQLISFLVALVLVIVLNVSAVHVTQRLWKQPIDTGKITQVKAEEIKDKDAAENFLKKLGQVEVLAPTIGWKDLSSFAKFWDEDLWSSKPIDENGDSIAFDAWSRIVGWLITALATLFGAPFWFDALQQIIRLKGAGPSPAEKRQDKGAAA